MHSRIVIFSFNGPSKIKLSKDDLDMLYDERPNRTIDYISYKDLNFKEEFENICSHLSSDDLKNYIKINKKDKSIEFKKGFEEKFFERRLAFLKPLVAAQTGKTFSSFLNYLEIKQLICETDGLWFKDYTNNEWSDWFNTDQLIRYLKLTDRKIWIIEILDYHL